MELYITYHFSV